MGGGPAGASLAIRCAAAGLNTVVVERESFPREKLCGEFISPECVLHFKELGVSDHIAEAGARRLTETRFFSISGREAAIPCDWFGGEALGLSRARMDKILLDAARDSGAEVLERSQAVGIHPDKGNVRSIEVNRGGVQRTIEGDIFVDATGRSAVLSKLMARQNATGETKNSPAAYLGFKTHLRGTALPPGRCEMYLFRGGYAGLSHVEDGRANLCFLIETTTARRHGATGERIMREAIMANPRAREVLRDVIPEERWLTVAVEGFGKRVPPRADNLISIGDAASFIDPFTGSGMLMAFQSSELLAKCLEGSDRDLLARFEVEHKSVFGRRLLAAGALRTAAMNPRLASAAIASVFQLRLFRSAFARLTR